MSPTAKGYANTERQKSADWSRGPKEYYEITTRSEEVFDGTCVFFLPDVFHLQLTVFIFY